MKLAEIQELIKMLNRGKVGEVQIKQGDFRLTLRTTEFAQANAKSGKSTVSVMPSMPASSAPAPATPSPAPPKEAGGSEKKEETKAKGDDNVVTIKSPMVGTFYRRPSPDKEPFVKVGDVVQEGEVICMIEAMKLFNEIEAEVVGKIVKVLVEDSTPVEYDQPLFQIDTSETA